MESIYANASNYNGGEKSYPDFDNFVQNAENGNSQLVRLLEEEIQKTLALQKELEAHIKEKEKYEHTSDELNEEAKELHKRFLQGKETIESRKKSTALLCEHEEELKTKYHITSERLDDLKVQNSQVVEKYQNIWGRYHAKYESSETAGKLSEVKTAVLKRKDEVKDAEDKLAQLKLQVTEVENEKNSMEDLIKQGFNSPKTTMVNLAEMYLEIKRTDTLVQEKLQKQQQDEQQALEKDNTTQRETCEDQQVQLTAQEMECDQEQSGLEQFAQTSPNTPAQQTVPSPPHTNQEEGSISQPRRGEEYNQQISQSVVQTAIPQIPSSLPSVPGQILSTPISRQPVSIGRPFTFNSNGLAGYKRLGTPMPTSITSTPSQITLPTTPRLVLSNVDSVSVPSPRNNFMTGSFFNRGNGRSASTTQEQSLFVTTGEQQQTVPCSQINESQSESPSIVTNATTTAKSPGPSCSSPTSPKTPTSVSHQQGDFFNFGDYQEKIQMMSKSPGEGFSFHSRPMFDTIPEEEGNTATSTADDQASFLQPFFKPRQKEINDQFSTTPSFFNMSSNQDLQEIGQQNNQFQVSSNSSSSSLCSSLFSMSPRPTKESEQSNSVGFLLFGDQSSPKSGNHGNQPMSPDFTFNFGASPSISDDRGQGSGGFNLF